MAGKQPGKRSGSRRASVVVAAVNGERVRVLQAAARGKDVEILRSGAGQVEPGAGPGRAVADTLRRAGIRERKVVLALPASDVVIKRVQLPPATPEQLPQLVAYEAQRHLPLPISQLATGYQQSPGHAREAPGSEVLLAVTRKAELARLERELAAAGLQVEGYGIEPLGTAESFLAASGGALNGTARLLLAPDDSGMQAQILQGRRVLLSRYVPFEGDEWAADLRRSLAAFSVEAPEAPVEEVVLLGDAGPEAVAEALGRPVRRGDGGHEGAAQESDPLAGVARQWLGLGELPLRIEPQGWREGGAQPGRLTTAMAVGSAVLLAVLLVVWQLEVQGSRAADAEQARRISRQVQRDGKLLAELRSRRDLLREQSRVVGAGTRPDAPPLELLRKVSGIAPAGVWLTQMTYQAGAPLQLEGATRDAAQVTQFLRLLEGVPGFRSVQVGYLRSGTVSETPVTQFRIDCLLAESAPSTRREGER